MPVVGLRIGAGALSLVTVRVEFWSLVVSWGLCSGLRCVLSCNVRLVREINTVRSLHCNYLNRYESPCICSVLNVHLNFSSLVDVCVSALMEKDPAARPQSCASSWLPGRWLFQVQFRPLASFALTAQSCVFLYDDEVNQVLNNPGAKKTMDMNVLQHFN